MRGAWSTPEDRARHEKHLEKIAREICKRFNADPTGNVLLQWGYRVDDLRHLKKMGEAAQPYWPLWRTMLAWAEGVLRGTRSMPQGDG